MKTELFDGAWCRLRNGAVVGPAIPVKSFSGHEFLVGGLYYSVQGECQAGREFDVVVSRASPDHLKEAAGPGAKIFPIEAGARNASRVAASVEGMVTASLSGDAEVASLDIAVSTSFGLISASVSFTAAGLAFVYDQRLQIANNEPMALSERALDRCGILRGSDWRTFREILVEAARREVAA